MKPQQFGYGPASLPLWFKQAVTNIRVTEMHDSIAVYQAAPQSPKGIKAKQDVILNSMPLVVYFARQLAIYPGCFEDMVQSGVIGVCEALDRFENDHACTFSTYAAFWIIKSMRQERPRRRRHVPVKLTQRMRRLLMQAHRFQQEYYLAYGTSISSEALDTQLRAFFEGDSPPNRESLRHMHLLLHTKAIPLDATHHNDVLTDQRYSLEDTLAGAESDNPEQRQELREQCELAYRIRSVILTGSPLAVACATATLGLDGNEPLTLREAGAFVGLSHERVRQINKVTLHSARQTLGLPEDVFHAALALLPFVSATEVEASPL
ncbi:MAG: sigma-70 family RNA polymerase sigma factor [Patescibacteria group bacterium]